MIITLILGALAISQLLISVALKLLDYKIICLWHVGHLSFGVGEGDGEEKRRKSKESVVHRARIFTSSV